MKKTFLQQFLFAVFLLYCIGAKATDELITEQVVVNLQQAGTLANQISDDDKYKITNLKITGAINGTDLRMIRDMAGSDYQTNPTDGKLATLDLSEAKIVNGGEAYYSFNSTYYTKVNELGACAFSECESLTRIEIPSSVTSIGEGAFSYCENLASIEIPSGVTSIGEDAFWNCFSLTSIKIPSGVTSISGWAFCGCKSLTSFEILSSVTSIGESAFRGCKGLTSIKIPSSVTSIGESAFEGCKGLTSIKIPSGVTSIGDQTFYDCSSLTSIEIPSSVTSIGLSAFRGCSSLTSIEIPSSVTSIGGSAFRGCSSLTSIEIPFGVTSIDDQTFYNCSKLTSIEIPSSVTSIGKKAFISCSSLASIEIPSSVTSIGSYAFSGCSSLASVEIPSSVTTIGEYAFSGCSGLASIYVSRETPVSITTDVFDNIDKQKCILYVPQGTSQDYSNATGWGDFKNIVGDYYKIGDTKCYLCGENPCVDNLELEDGKDFVATVPFKATAASYSRTMTSNWGTLCLPFAVETANTDSKFYEIKGVNNDNDVITLTQLNGTIAAGTPVLVYSTNGLNISASNVDVVTTPVEGAVNGWQLVGSFAETEVPDDGYIISKNKFWLTSDLKSNTSVKAVKTKGLRAYLKSGNSSAAKAHVLGFAFDDEDKTSAIDAIDGLTEGTAEIYDIQGRRTDRLQKGLNIVKMGSVTKKVMVK